MRDAQREMSVVQRQLASLEQDRRRITAQMVAVQFQFNQIIPITTGVSPGQTYQAQPIPSKIVTTPPPAITRNGNNSNNQNSNNWNNLRRRLSIDDFARASALSVMLATLNKQAFDIDRQMLPLRARAAQLTGQGSKDAADLRESQEAAAKAAKRAERLEKQLAREASKETRTTRGPAGRMLSFSTYFPLPYEREKERVLGWFAK